MIPYQICRRPTSQVCACVCVLSNYTSGSQVNTNRLLLSTSGMHMSFDRAPHSSGWWLGKTTPNSKGHGIHSLGAVTCSSPSMSTSALQWTTKCIEHVPNELNATTRPKNSSSSNSLCLSRMAQMVYTHPHMELSFHSPPLILYRFIILYSPPELRRCKLRVYGGVCI